LEAKLPDGRYLFARLYRANLVVECTGGGSLVPTEYVWTLTSTKTQVTLQATAHCLQRCPTKAPQDVDIGPGSFTASLHEAPCVVSVMVVGPSSTFDVGHAALRVTCGEFDVIYGYYPTEKGDIRSVAGTPGEVLVRSSADTADGIGMDMSSYYAEEQKRCWVLDNVPCAACDQLRKYWNNLADNPGTYYLLTNNCTTQVQDSLKSAGIKLFPDFQVAGEDGMIHDVPQRDMSPTGFGLDMLRYGEPLVVPPVK
jgi:hypothetical protein